MSHKETGAAIALSQLSAFGTSYPTAEADYQSEEYGPLTLTEFAKLLGIAGISMLVTKLAGR